jgi:hypothetical protein
MKLHGHKIVVLISFTSNQHEKTSTLLVAEYVHRHSLSFGRVV